MKVGEQDGLEQHGGRIGGGTRFIIAKSRIKSRQVDFMIEQMVQCVFDGAAKKLPLQIYREKARAGVDMLVARHIRNKPLSFALLAGGILLVIFGVNASNSFDSSISRIFTGSPTDKAIWMMVGGVVVAVVGLLGTMRGSK